jgi:hypothetical protein
MNQRELLQALIVPCYNNGIILDFDMHNVCDYNDQQSKQCNVFSKKFSILPPDKHDIIIELILTKSKKLALLNINSPIPLMRLAAKYALDMNYCRHISLKI